jgi:hypothetical protein
MLSTNWLVNFIPSPKILLLLSTTVMEWNKVKCNWTIHACSSLFHFFSDDAMPNFRQKVPTNIPVYWLKKRIYEMENILHYNALVLSTFNKIWIRILLYLLPTNVNSSPSKLATHCRCIKSLTLTNVAQSTVNSKCFQFSFRSMLIENVTGFRVMVFNATFNNISVISWWSILQVEETRVPGENHRPAASHWQTLSHNVVSTTHRTDCIGWKCPVYTSIQ